MNLKKLMNLKGDKISGIEPMSIRRPAKRDKGVMKIGTRAIVFSGSWNRELSRSPIPSEARRPAAISKLYLERELGISLEGEWDLP